MTEYKNNIEELNINGLTVLKQCYDKKIIHDARQKILNHLNLLRNTKPGEPSLHLAGFHHHPELEELHYLVSANPKVLNFLSLLMPERVKAVGNSDITINRSQHWHKDLLRGKYAAHHNVNNIWGKNGGGVYRIILYLQNTQNLKIVFGSHLIPHSLESDIHAIPKDESNISLINVNIGDIVVMDIRTTHRGMTTDYIQNNAIKLNENPSIMIATILGNIKSPLTKEMEMGNFHRQIDWMERHYEPI